MANMVEPAQCEQGARKERTAVGHTILVAVVVAVVLALAYFGISGYVADKVSRPTRKLPTTNPASYGLAYEDVRFPSAVDGIELKGWFVDSPGKKTIVMFHGRNSRRDDPDIGLMDVAKGLVDGGYDVLLFDFRAHGESGGTRYSLGQWEVRDVAGALNYLEGRGVYEVGTIGYSMGAATELLAAPDHSEMRAIVADAPFANLSALLDVQLPRSSGLPAFFNPGVVFMVRTLYSIDVMNNKPERAMASLGSRPVLLIHGTTDETIPIDHAYALQKAGAKNPNLEVWIVPGSQHVKSFRDHPHEYMSKVLTFFNKNLR